MVTGAELPTLEMSPIVTFHGPDGCGKTTVAQKFHLDRVKNGDDSLFIGSSSFTDWVTEDLYERFIGSPDRLAAGTAPNAEPTEKTALYEDLAVCLYGLAIEHSLTRGTVVIHSDPYLKRLAWARRSLELDEFRSYAQQFDDYIGERLGDVFASHAVTIEVDAGNCFERINSRGPVSEYDPATFEETVEMVEAIDALNGFLFTQERPFPRLADAEIVSLLNPTWTSENREGVHSELVKYIGSRIEGLHYDD